MNEYRMVVGERGNEQGHIIPCEASSEVEARAELAKALEPYRGDGWGRVEVLLPGGWYRLES